MFDKRPYWKRHDLRRPFPPLYKAVEMFGAENVYFEQPKYVEDGYCKWCGKKIENKRRKEFCSNECSQAFGRATVWQRGRDPYSLRILYRDNFTCQDCEQFLACENKYGVHIPIDNGAEVHHIKPVSEGGGDEPTNLVTLCAECHKDRHKRMRGENSNA